MLDVQDCAAKHTLQYARACSFTDLKFARPAAPEVSTDSNFACIKLLHRGCQVKAAQSRVLCRLIRFRWRRQP